MLEAAEHRRLARPQRGREVIGERDQDVEQAVLAARDVDDPSGD